MPQQIEPIHGQAFAEILAELYAHTFPGAPGQSDPFTLPVLLREYIAYALSVYYHCDKCQTHHKRTIERELKKANASQCPSGGQGGSDWPWEALILDMVLYTRIEYKNICEDEWARWKRDWLVFVSKLGAQSIVAHLVAFAIAAARNDTQLLAHEQDAIRAAYLDRETLQGVLRDIMRVVGFMKAATTINRVTPVFNRILHETEAAA